MVASEMTGRKLAFDRMYTSIIEREGIPAFKDELRKRYGDGADAVFERIQAEASAKGGRSHSGFFSPGDVLAATNDAQLQRIWQRTLNNASERGVKEADHLFFSGGTTNADEIARRTLTFHYWMVRSSALYGRTLLRNPVLLSGFVKMYQEAQRIGEEQGLPDWLNGMMKFYQIPGNATGYAAMDPIGVLFPTFFMDAYSQEGNKFQAVQNLLVPVWSAALGALGLTQNVPNATGTKGIERFVIDMGNFLKGEGVDLAAIPGFGKYIDNDSLTLTIPSEEFTSYLMQAANNVLQRAGVAFGDFQPFDRQANEEDQLFSIGQQIAIQLYGPDMESWTPEQVAELEAAVHQAQYGDGEETWLSETIRANFGREGGARALAALVIPGGVVTRQSYRDEQMALASDYWDAFFSGKATTKDGESAAAGRQMVTAANPVWTALDQEYHAIGTETQQQQHKLFYSMLLSPDRLNPNQSIILDNGDGTYTFYTMRQLAGMDQDDREKVVYAWLESHPDVQANVEFVKNGRDAFKEAHPDYAQYSTYQSGVYDYPGGIAQFRRDMRDNDAFRAAEEAERARLKAQGKSGSVLEAELDQWATSQEAFHAAVGIPYKRGDSVDKTPGPSSVAAVFSLRPDESKSGGSKKSDESKDEPKDPRIDDYWSPEKGVPRLLQDLAQWEYDNQKMEQRFPDAWNAETGDWEDHADSAKERKELGIYNQTFYTPSVTETMKRYEEWEQMNPGGTPEEFFTEMLATEGFGIKVGVPQKAAPKLPGGTVVTPPARPGVTAAMNLLQGRVVNVPKVGSRPQEDSGAERVIEVAKSYVGQIPYVWGSIPGKGQDPSGGWDCSGMVYWLDQNYGTGQLPMGSHYQYQYAIDSGKLFTDMSELQPGDIVFLDTGWYGGAGGNLNPAGHVGIYAGNGQLIQATNESQGTVIKPLDAYGRILGAMHGAWT
jgi:cell wall-associated NlpC family hydrolase